MLPAESLCMPPEYSLSHFDFDDIQLNEKIRDYIVHLHSSCFMIEDVDEIVTPENMFDHLVGFHDPRKCHWVMLFHVPTFEPIGMITFVPYVSSFFVFNLCIAPLFRRRHLASVLLGIVAQAARSNGLLAISGNVDREDTLLIQMYQDLGGNITSIGVQGKNSNPSKKIRVVRTFQAEEVDEYIKRVNLKISKGTWYFPSYILIGIAFFAAFAVWSIPRYKGTR